MDFFLFWKTSIYFGTTRKGQHIIYFAKGSNTFILFDLHMVLNINLFLFLLGNYLQGRRSIALIKMSMLLTWLLLCMTDWVISMGQLTTVPQWRRGPTCCFLVITLGTWECLMVWTTRLEYLWVFCKFVKLAQPQQFIYIG
jgi:hypothetical protein